MRGLRFCLNETKGLRGLRAGPSDVLVNGLLLFFGNGFLQKKQKC